MRRLGERKESKGEEKTAFSPSSNDLDKNASSRSTLKVLRVPLHPLSLPLPGLEHPPTDSTLFPSRLFIVSSFSNREQPTNLFSLQESAGYWFLNRRLAAGACFTAWAEVSPGLLARVQGLVPFRYRGFQNVV